ncbi:MAG: hypothetical protein AseanaTS_18660 [Candidatus Pelagadaptatus aseana]|uniref:hypothetical protein n=1 Tax=Candidatus Pelagadaptatus aseana TaxID=3120508 RepID=UPI0039B1CC5C
MSTFQRWVIVLLLANLAATVYFGLTQPDSSSDFSEQSDKTAELPVVVSGVVRDRWFNQFREAFNREDFDAVYDMFSPAAQARIDKADMYSELRRLKKAFYQLKPDGAYSHSEFVKNLGDAQVYTLFYNVSFSERSEFGSSGTLKITIAVQGDRLQVLGIHLMSN